MGSPWQVGACLTLLHPVPGTSRHRVSADELLVRLESVLGFMFLGFFPTL